MEEATFRRVMSDLGTMFNRPMSDDVLSLYRRALADLTDAQIVLAGDRCLRSRRFMPKPSELRDALAEARETQSPAAHRDGPVCETCSGNGWVEHQCTGRGECGGRVCAALGYAHGVASRCPSCKPGLAGRR